MTFNKKVFIFFLDNHDSKNYCSKDPLFVHDIFDKIFTDYNLFVEEPIYKDDNIKLIFNSVHVSKYLEYLKTKKAYYFDTRFYLQDTDINKTFYNILLFLTSTNIEELIKINNNCKKHRKLLVIFIYHFFKYYRNNLIPQKNTNYLLYTKFPFIKIEELVNNTSNNELLELLLNSTMEFYLILLLLNTNKNNNIIYLGAAHGITITRILEKEYNFIIDIDLKLEIKDIFNLSNLDSFDSCI